MKNLKYLLATSILATAFGVSAQAEVTGKYTFETAQFNGGDGQTIGVTSANRTKDTFKNEHSIRMYVDGDLETSLLPNQLHITSNYKDSMTRLLSVVMIQMKT